MYASELRQNRKCKVNVGLYFISRIHYFRYTNMTFVKWNNKFMVTSQRNSKKKHLTKYKNYIINSIKKRWCQSAIGY